jgi:hypothetical protein
VIVAHAGSHLGDWDLTAIAGLGAFHGVNPAMGWLFAVAIGLQTGSRRALLLALVPLAIGHEASVGATLLLVEELHVLASDTAIRIGCGSLLGVFAMWKLWRAGRHVRWVGMRLRFHELALWSFLMASAHGAGLMLFPFAVGDGGSGHERASAVLASGALDAAVAAGVHTAAMATVAGIVAVLVHEVVGVGIVRRGWLNVDRIWAVSLLAGAVATLFVP